MDHFKINCLLRTYRYFYDYDKSNEIDLISGLTLNDPIFSRTQINIMDFIGEFSFEEIKAAGFCLSTFICNPNYKLKYGSNELIKIGFRLQNIKFIEDFIFYCGLPRQNGLSLHAFLKNINPYFVNIEKLREIGFSCRDLKKISDGHSRWWMNIEIFPIEKIIDVYTHYELDINFSRKTLENYHSYQIRAVNHLKLSDKFLSIIIQKRIQKKNKIKILQSSVRRTIKNNPISSARLLLCNVIKRRAISKKCNFFQELRDEAIIIQAFVRRFNSRKKECDICKFEVFSFESYHCDNFCNYCVECLHNLVESEITNISSGMKNFTICCGLCFCKLHIDELLLKSGDICYSIVKAWWELGLAKGHQSFYARYLSKKDKLLIPFIDPSLIYRYVMINQSPEYNLIVRSKPIEMCSLIQKLDKDKVLDFFSYLSDLSFCKGESDEFQILNNKYKTIFEKDPAFFYVDDIQSRILNPRCPKCKKIVFWFDGCFAIECSCGKHICGWCLNFYGSSTETHKHVLECDLSYHSGDLYGKIEEFEWIHTMKAFFKFHDYLLTITSKSLREKVRKRIIDSNSIMDPEIFYQVSLLR